MNAMRHEDALQTVIKADGELSRAGKVRAYRYLLTHLDDPAMKCVKKLGLLSDPLFMHEMIWAASNYDLSSALRILPMDDHKDTLIEATNLDYNPTLNSNPVIVDFNKILKDEDMPVLMTLNLAGFEFGVKPVEKFNNYDLVHLDVCLNDQAYVRNDRIFQIDVMFREKYRHDVKGGDWISFADEYAVYSARGEVLEIAEGVDDLIVARGGEHPVLFYPPYENKKPFTVATHCRETTYGVLDRDYDVEWWEIESKGRNSEGLDVFALVKDDIEMALELDSPFHEWLRSGAAERYSLIPIVDSGPQINEVECCLNKKGETVVL